MILDILIFFAGIFLLIMGAHFITKYASKIAKRHGVSEYVVGITLVALATSLPEISISIISGITSLLEPSTYAVNIATGTIIGSNITNIGLILGMSALLMPLALTKEYLKEEYFMLLISFLLYIFLIMGMDCSGGIVITAVLVGYIGYIYLHKKYGIKAEVEELYYKMTLRKSILDIILCFIGGLILIVGSVITIESVLSISFSFGVSKFLIALIGISFGTSLPELSASIMAALKKMGGISVGNLIGSNIFNILGLAIASFFSPILTNHAILFVDAPIMLLLSTAVLVFAKTKGHVSRTGGVFLLTIYIIFLLIHTKI